MVDVHCHILPGVDDGAKSWEIAEEMCRMAHADGITHIVASPHSNNEFQYDRTAHEERLAELQSRVPQMRFSLGCDMHLSFDNIEAALSDTRRFAIGNTRYLLVEFSEFSIPRSIENVLQDLQGAGLIPIVTHPERNPVMQRHPDMVERLANLGCLVQVTANSITGFWGSTPKKMSESLIKKGLVDLVASDAHDTRRRVPILSEARKALVRLAGEERAQAMVEYAPRAIVNDEKLR